MCVIGAAFFKTGMAYKTSQFLLKYTKSERGLILVITLLSGIMSGFVSNSGTVAVLLPIVMGIAAGSASAFSENLATKEEIAGVYQQVVKEER